MKVLGLRNCWAGDVLVEEGKVAEVPDKAAQQLIRMGKAAEAPAEEAKPRATRKAKAEATDGAE
jgi:hypothetical protein